jgi:ribose-phosphate pyrophosphokinase
VNDFIVTATRSMKRYAARVVEELTRFPSFTSLAASINRVETLDIKRFDDGEMEIAIKEPLRGKNVILFASCAKNEAGIGVEEAKIELYQTIDALKRSQAARITVFEPFVSCSRSDRTTGRNSVGLWVHFKILASLGANHIVTYQLHSDKSKSMLDPTICLIDDIPVLTLLKTHLCDTYIRDLKTLEKVVRPNWAFCSVDAGGEKLARQFANAFMAPLVVAHKQRDYSQPNSVESVNILSAEPIVGKTLWVVDDMIDTGGSVATLIKALAPLKPAEINIMATHALFSPNYRKHLPALKTDGLLNRVIVTDTVYCAGTSDIPNLEVVPSARLSANVVNTVVTNGSVAQLMKPFNAESYFKKRGLF